MADPANSMRLDASGAVPSKLKTVSDTAGIGTTQNLSCDICVIGAGSGGLSVASAAAQLGVDVILIEKHKMAAIASTTAACRQRR